LSSTLYMSLCCFSLAINFHVSSLAMQGVGSEIFEISLDDITYGTQEDNLNLSESLTNRQANQLLADLKISPNTLGQNVMLVFYRAVPVYITLIIIFFITPAHMSGSKAFWAGVPALLGIGFGLYAVWDKRKNDIDFNTQLDEISRFIPCDDQLISDSNFEKLLLLGANRTILKALGLEQVFSPMVRRSLDLRSLAAKNYFSPAINEKINQLYRMTDSSTTELIKALKSSSVRLLYDKYPVIFETLVENLPEVLATDNEVQQCREQCIEEIIKSELTSSNFLYIIKTAITKNNSQLINSCDDYTEVHGIPPLARSDFRYTLASLEYKDKNEYEQQLEFAKCFKLEKTFHQIFKIYSRIKEHELEATLDNLGWSKEESNFSFLNNLSTDDSSVGY
jgi:hypothetical protein